MKNDSILHQARKLKPELIKLRRAIHAFPELGFEEYKTSALIAKNLKALGLQVHTGVAKTGVVGILNKSQKQPVIALRADMDALPVTEKTRMPFASKNKGVMHACGHDAHVTCVLGAAMILSKMKDKLGGCVKFIFQPNEESAGGAELMIKQGVLKNPCVDVIIGMHTHPELLTGKLGIKYGTAMASVDRFTLTVIGKGSHGAYPHKGIDAILVASDIVIALQALISRQINPVEPAVITIGTIEGGSNFNVLADRVVMTGTVRSINKKLHARLPIMIRKVVRGVAQSHGATVQLDYKVIGYPLVNDTRITNMVKRSASRIIGRKNVVEITEPSMGGDDFASYLSHVPGSFVYLGVRNQLKKTIYPWHHSRFTIDENALVFGIAVLAGIVRDYLSSSDTSSSKGG